MSDKPFTCRRVLGVLWRTCCLHYGVAYRAIPPGHGRFATPDLCWYRQETCCNCGGTRVVRLGSIT